MLEEPVSFLMSFRLSACISANSTGLIFVKFDIGNSHLHCYENILSRINLCFSCVITTALHSTLRFSARRLGIVYTVFICTAAIAFREGLQMLCYLQA